MPTVCGNLARKAEEWRRLEEEQDIHLSRLVRHVLEGGAPLLFHKGPPPARPVEAQLIRGEEQIEQMDKFVERALRQGALEETETRPMVVSPTFIIPKKTPGKFRVIVDLRYVNQFQETPSLREEDLSEVSRL